MVEVPRPEFGMFVCAEMVSANIFTQAGDPKRAGAPGFSGRFRWCSATMPANRRLVR